MLRLLHLQALVLLVCGVVALSISCASTRTPSPAGGESRADATQSGRPIRVRYATYASGQNLELVDKSHTDPTELYSTKHALEDAGRKVTTDEVLEATLDYFKSKGFFDKAQPGAAPATAEGVYSQSLEVETPGRLVHSSLLRSGSPQAERQMFFECAQAFVQIYNDTYQLQSVDRAPDWNVQKNAPKKKAP